MDGWEGIGNSGRGASTGWTRYSKDWNRRTGARSHGRTGARSHEAPRTDAALSTRHSALAPSTQHPQPDRPMPNTLQITPQGDREIVFIRPFDAPRTKVWRALTEPALIKQWLGNMPDWTFPLCEVDLRVGGKYRYEWRNT